VSEDSPGISGPSFLGLNDPPSRKRGSLSADPHSSSSNLDYLLEDEEPRRSGAGKFALILLMLALAGTFGYFRWKWLQVGQTKRPAATSQTPDPSATTYVLPPSGEGTASPTPATAQPATPAPQPVPDAASAITPAADNHATTPDAGGESSAKAEAPAQNETSKSSPDSSTATEPAAKEPAESATAAVSDTPPEPAPKPTKMKRPAAEPKPHAGVTPTRSADAVSEAQKYIYGRGVTQDCERGMRLLKPAAAQANPKAMVEMGALYSAGLCTPHDLPTAYRWFAMALRKDPDNQSVQNDLQKLWGEMTQPERQLAIKLSQ